MKISLVIPVFNAEAYIHRMLNSVLAQSYNDWEVVIVDDGSTDKSSTICDEYAQKKSNIKVIHKNNEGCSAARQTGMIYVSGDYVLHIDSDDWLEEDCLKCLVESAVANNSDIVMCDAFCNENDVWKFDCEPMTPDGMIHAILGQKLWGVLWNKMVRTSIAKAHGIVPQSVSMWEDIAYIIPCLLHSKVVSKVNKPLYHYNIDNNGSMIHKQQTKNMAVEYCSALNHLEKVLVDSERLNDFIYELRGLQLFAIRDYIDDLRYRDYDKFMNTYPEALEHINEYPDYPKRIKACYWLIKNKLNFAVHSVWKTMLLFTRLK